MAPTHEQLVTAPLQPETVEELVVRMKSSMDFVPGEEELDTSRFNIDLMGRPSDEGTTWGLTARNPIASEPISTDSPGGMVVYEKAIDALQRNPDAWPRLARSYQWWNVDMHGIKEDAENRATEYFEIGGESRKIGLLNCTPEAVSDEEMRQIEVAVQAVSNLTDGKIFDRVRGIMLCQDDRFKEDAGADFGKGTRIVRINMDNVRANANVLNDRYKPYLGKHGRLEAYLAHEFGHAMDVDTLSEIRAAGLNEEHTTGTGLTGTSAFDDKFGWAFRSAEKKNESRWVINPAEQIECREDALTGYAQVSPQEDFAETFALMALEGNTSSVNERVKIVRNTIENAEG